VDTETIGTALHLVTQALESDGYTVDVELATGAVMVRVTAGPDACEECLVPKPLMTQLVIQALADAGMALVPEQIRLAYPGEQE
jgi:hypothetical protein